VSTQHHAETGPLLTITAPARELILDLRAGQPEPERLALWIEPDAGGGDHPYELYLYPTDQAASDDLVQHLDGLPVVICGGSDDALRGAVVDRVTTTRELVLVTAPRPSPAVGVRANGRLRGDVAERVRQVLSEHINPSIAAHGGRAELESVSDGVAYLRLGGGCQGCGIAPVTLRQGIEVAITQAVPEIERVVDVTDHANGTNPFYPPSTPSSGGSPRLLPLVRHR
jgi:Fe/S biogenesis protein NfuA